MRQIHLKLIFVIGRVAFTLHWFCVLVAESKPLYSDRFPDYRKREEASVFEGTFRIVEVGE